MNVEQTHSKDISNLAAVVNWASDVKRHGSFADRRPDLGKMGTCVFCHVRRRVNGPLCCNHPFAKDAEGNDRSVEAMFSKPFLRKLRAKHHGQSRAFHFRQLSFRLQQDEELLKLCANKMQVPIPKMEHIGAFAEKFWLWSAERKDRAERQRSRESRRINRE